MADAGRRLAGLPPEERRRLLREILERASGRALSGPLSLGQEALWFLDRLDPGSAAYSLFPAVRLFGPLDVEALESAFDRIIRRHEPLRTTFPAIDGRPGQQIAPPSRFELPVVDLAHLDEAARLAEAKRLAAERPPIDLENGPLLRVRLLRLAPADHVVLGQIHHIVFDGWSTGVLARELSILYAAHRSGRPAELPELPARYADFVAWQREILAGERRAPLEDYWRRQLADLPPLELPTLGRRPALRSSRGASLPVHLRPELAEAVLDFGRRWRVTPFQILLAGFFELLHRYGGQEDFAVGTPAANRRKREFEPLVGYFINMLVLRADLSGDPSFEELVRRVRRTALDAWQHQELTLDKVVEAVRPERDPGRHPLFQAMFVLQNNRRPPLSLPGIEALPFGDRGEGRAAKFELTVPLRRTDRGFEGVFNFNTDLFSPSLMERMAADFGRLLGEGLADPARPLSRLPLVDGETRARLLVEWGGAAAGLPPGVLPHESFEAVATRTPDAVALVDGARGWSYAELRRRSGRIAQHLRELGAGPERVVALLLPRSAELVASLLGVLEAGGAFLLLDPDWPAPRIASLVADAAAEIVVAERSLSLPGVRHLVDPRAIGDGELPTVLSRTGDRRLSDRDLAMVISTSGSSGRPKGVLVEQGSLARYVEDARRLYGLTAADRILQFAPVSSDPIVEELFPILASGGTVVLRSEASVDPRELLRQCAAEGVTVLTLPTAWWHELVLVLENEPIELPESLRLVIIGGEAPRPERVAGWFSSVGRRVRLINTYGPTEATVVATAADLAPEDGEGERVPMGRPLPGSRAYVLDSRLRPVPIGVTGELYLGGRSVARGYLGGAEEDPLPFLPDPFSEGPGARMHRTGDLVRWREDGRLEFLGRRGDEAKIRGFRVHPDEVQHALALHPDVAEAAVVPRPLPSGELGLVAYVAGRESGPPPTGPELRRMLGERLPRFMIPSLFVAVESIPRFANGKVDRKALPAAFPVSASGERRVMPGSESERQLAPLVAEVLGLPEVGIQESFFDLGGDSLLALRLASRVRRELGVDLPLSAIFSDPTVAGLAVRLDELASPALAKGTIDSLLGAPSSVRPRPPLVVLDPGGSGTPLFCIHGLGGMAAAMFPLARLLGSSRTVYGLDALGLARGETPHSSIEEMADCYAEAIRSVRPRPPWLLAGWSMGGLVALEVAARLASPGEQLPFVALLDSSLAIPDRASDEAGDAEVLGRVARQAGLSPAMLRPLSPARQWELIARQARLGDRLGAEEIARLAALCRVQLAALSRHVPARYSGPALLLRAAATPGRFDHRWRQLAPRLVVRRVPGNHFTMLRPPHVATLAPLLAEALDEESGGDGAVRERS
jgi:amino acid adenylation domain-containing protein